MKPVLFIDFDGTICADRFWRNAPLEIKDPIQKLLFDDNKVLVGEWMLGKHTSEDICEFVSNELSLPYEVVWWQFVEDCTAMYVSEKTLELISTLRDKYVIILLTDNMDCFNRFTVPALGLASYFDEITNSAYTHVFKNDASGQIFKDIAKKYGVGLEFALLIDNSAKVCEVFSALGGTVFHVKGENTAELYLAGLVAK